MKKLMLLCAALFVLTAHAQNDAKSVRRLSCEKCQSIQKGGHYVMERKMKFMSDKDTEMLRFTCDFRKLPDDTIYGKASLPQDRFRPGYRLRHTDYPLRGEHLD